MLNQGIDKFADVICMHKRDGTIIPIKIRIEDDDGEFQTYKIKAYKDLTHYGNCTLPNGISISNYMWEFECKIEIFNIEKRIILHYNIRDNSWRVKFPNSNIAI